jgi:PAS domain S-box-containing protein
MSPDLGSAAHAPDAHRSTSHGAARSSTPGKQRTDELADEALGRVLIVDDDPVIRELYTIVLTRAKIDTDAVASGRAAIAYLHDHDVSVMLLDYQMPGMSGLDVLREVRSDPAIADMRVIFVTAIHSLEDRVAGLDIGAYDYLAKPVAHKELVALVRTQLQGQASDRAIRNVVESANDAYVSWDHDGKILDWNARAGEIFGWSRTQVLGRPFSETLLSAPYRVTHERNMDRLSELGETPLHGESAEMTGLHCDGTDVPVEMTIGTAESHGRAVFHALIKDLRV